MHQPSWDYYKELTWLFNQAVPTAAPTEEEAIFEDEEQPDPDEQVQQEQQDLYHALFDDPAFLLTLLGE